jgi:hypothetical protein
MTGKPSLKAKPKDHRLSSTPARVYHRPLLTLSAVSLFEQGRYISKKKSWQLEDKMKQA